MMLCLHSDLRTLIHSVLAFLCILQHTLACVAATRMSPFLGVRRFACTPISVSASARA